MNILFFDTETTGLPIFKKPSEDPDQPYILSIAGLLCDERGNSWGSVDLILDNNVDIPNEATAVHGISSEDATRYGVNPLTALEAFKELYYLADLVVAHNLSFDERMLRIMTHKLSNFEHNPNVGLCTMLRSTAACEIPHPRASGYKWPTLAEAHEKLVGKKITDAHTAMGDVISCKNLFFKLVDLGHITLDNGSVK